MKKTVIKCPRCQSQTFWQENPSRPFCSEKCRQIDLGRWSAEEYSINGDPVPQQEQDQDHYSF